MKGNRNAAPIANDKNGTQTRFKGNEYYLKRQVRLLFLSGRKLTAREINREVGFNDARKVISDLRHKENMNIKDVRQDDNCKLYWLELDNQPTLFGKEACNE